jgi:ABC-type multidrug transport system fused ATPase/permease subunit
MVISVRLKISASRTLMNKPSSKPAPSKALPTLRRLLGFSGRNGFLFALAVLIVILQVFILIGQSHSIRRALDAVLAGDALTFWRWIALDIALALANMPCSFVRTRSLGLFSERTLARIREKVASQLNGLPVGYLEERHSGDFLSVMNADLAKIGVLTGSSLLSLVEQSLQALGALIYIFFVSWQLTLVSLLATPLLFMVLSALSAPVAKRSGEMQEKVGLLNSIAQDVLNGLAVGRSFNLAKILDERFRQANGAVVRKGNSIARLRAGVNVLSQVVQFIPFLIALGIGGYLAITGRMTFGEIFAFINLLNFVVNPLGNIPGLIADISASLGAAQRIIAVLDQPLERSDGVVSALPALSTPAIRFQDLTFAYAGNNPVLKGVSFEVRSGEKVAVVGPSGSGKSTLLKLLLGYYPLEDGQVFLFGEDLNRWQLPAARAQMAFVAQDAYLFPVSAGENIALGNPGARQAEIERAAIAANIHDTLRSLPQGYATPVGERGTLLSGGQKQRLSLARAILKDTPILLLDEPTSALDSESEALVQEALDRFMAQHTSVVIAHRLSTIKNADRVLVLDGGRIVEEGTHEVLMQRGGLYCVLYEKQFSLQDVGGEV